MLNLEEPEFRSLAILSVLRLAFLRAAEIVDWKHSDILLAVDELSRSFIYINDATSCGQLWREWQNHKVEQKNLTYKN